MVIRPEEVQPQVITSPDKKLQIINHGAYIDAFGCYCVEGVIKNINSESELNAEIKIDYYAIDKTKIDTEVDTLTALKPGATRAFFIPCSARQRGDIRYYKLYPTVSKTS